MLSVEEAQRRALSQLLSLRSEKVSLSEAHGRSLAVDLYSSEPLPRWSNSAMDGYAVRSEDLQQAHPKALAVVESIAAGQTPTVQIGPNECARIFTGAPVPEGADAVLIQENAEQDRDRVLALAPVRAGQNIRRAGEELPTGGLALSKGTTLGPGAVGLCAAIGLSQVQVFCRPRIGILSTGNEVQEPGTPLQPGQIWSSNTPALTGLILNAGGLPIDLGRVGDDPAHLTRAIQGARHQELDILLTTGGVSVGDHDLVKEALTASGMNLDFWKIRMKPGKPLAFGHLSQMAVFGLPGNPVSCMVGFLQFVHPLIRASLEDATPFLPVTAATFHGDWRRRPGRAEFLRVNLSWEPDGLIAHLTGSQSSGMISSMAHAQGFALIDPSSTHLRTGDTISVQLFCPGYLGQKEPGYQWGGNTENP